jgi:hypothetical protein
MNIYQQETKQLAVEMRRAGKSSTEISASLSVPKGTLFKWIKGISTVAHPLYRTRAIRHDYFSPDNIRRFPERLVIVGFLAADGCISMKRSKQKIYPTLVINLAEKDRCVLDFINQEIADGERAISHLTKTNSNMLYFPSERLCADLARYNIVPRKTSTYKLPDLTVPEMSYFLRGYFYGDGCYQYDGKRDVYSFLGTTIFANQMKRFLIANGIVEHCCVSPLKRKPIYAQFLFQGRHAKAFARFIFQDDKMLLLPRKHNIRERDPLEFQV